MDLNMDALVQGYPYPSVTWSHDRLLLQNTWNNDSETSLIIRSVTVYESGQYTCYAKNSLGDNMMWSLYEIIHICTAVEINWKIYCDDHISLSSTTNIIYFI